MTKLVITTLLLSIHTLLLMYFDLPRNLRLFHLLILNHDIHVFFRVQIHVVFQTGLGNHSNTTNRIGLSILWALVFYRLAKVVFHLLFKVKDLALYTFMIRFFLWFAFDELRQTHALAQLFLFLGFLFCIFIDLKLTFVCSINKAIWISFIQLWNQIWVPVNWWLDDACRHIRWQLHISFHLSFLWWLSREKSHNYFQIFYITNLNQ